MGDLQLTLPVKDSRKSLITVVTGLRIRRRKGKKKKNIITGT